MTTKHLKRKYQSDSDSSSDSDSTYVTESSWESHSEESDDDFMDDESNSESESDKSGSEDEMDEEETKENKDSTPDGEEEEEFDQKEFRKLLYKKFPSKYAKQKLQEVEEGDESSSEDESKEKDKRKSKKKKTKSSSSKKHSNKKQKRKDDKKDKSSKNKDLDVSDDAKDFSIIFTSLANEMSEDSENHIQKVLNEETDEYNSDDERTFMKENYEQITMPDVEIVKDTNKDRKKKLKGKQSKQNKDKEKEKEELLDVEGEYLDLIELKKHIAKKLEKKPKSKILLQTYQDCKSAIQVLIRKGRTSNAKAYYKLLNTEQDSLCEIEYFKKKLSHKEQERAIAEMKEINSFIHTDKPYRLLLLQSQIPMKYKATVMQKLNTMEDMEPGDPEYYKLKNWVDTFMRVPFGIYKSLSISINDGIDVCSEYMMKAKQTLDDCVYGLEDAKLQTLQMIGQWITNPNALGTAIAIHGPMGTGKSSICKDGISKILGREFAFIALGGAGDASFLEGHSYTYEGSMWGKIIQILIDSKCMNPVIYFDELDKVSDTPRGQEIINVLMHLTDTTQNGQFHDKYFSEVDFDLSKCLFIFSYNDESLVNPILRDRMYRIQTKGYDIKEKIHIARKYILPKIREQVNFKEDEVVIPDDTISYLVSNARFTNNEQGVRNLKRCLEIIHTKLNLFRLVNDPDLSIFGKNLNLNVSFPFTVSRKCVDTLIKCDENQNQSLLAMYV